MLVKVKITVEFRNHKPAIWVNAFAYVNRLDNGLYEVKSVDGDYYSSGDTFDSVTRSFYTH